MKVRVIFVVCAVLTIGALYGRYQFLRDKGFINPEASFVDYVLRRADKKPPIEEESPAEPAPRQPKKGAVGSAPEKKEIPPKSKRTQRPQTPPEEIERVVGKAHEAIESGRYEEGLAALEDLPGSEAAQLRYRAGLLAHMVSDVDLDPGAGKRTIIVVTLRNGNQLYAVKAEQREGKWHVRLADGIGAGIPEKQVESVQEVKAEAFHKERLTVLRERLAQLTEGGVFDQWKGIRLAWRRGFAREAYRVFQDLAATPTALEALEIVLPPEKAEEIASLREPVEIAMAPGTSTEQPTTGEGSGPPGERVSRIALGGNEAFKAVDAMIREAQGNIHNALTTEGEESDRHIKEAGRLLTQARKKLLASTVPEGKARDLRLHRVTLLLDDFLKISSFGLK